MTRKLLCPICGELLILETDANTGGIPGSFLLPRHVPARLGHGNLCAAWRITVSFELSICEKCGQRMADHPSGLCMGCYGESDWRNSGTK